MVIGRILWIYSIYHNIDCSSYNICIIYKWRNHFCTGKNQTSQIDDSPLITTEQIDESMETNNTSPQVENKISLIE